MAETAVNFLIEKLWPLALDTFNLIDGLPEAVSQLKSDLQTFKAFLKDASRRDVDSEGWKQSVRDIRAAVYKAEDAIDRYLVQREIHVGKNYVEKKFDFLHVIRLRGLALEIKQKTQNVSGVRQNNQHLLEALQLNNIPIRATKQLEYPVTDEDDVVGLDGAADNVIGRLLGVSEDLEAVPIVGMAGLGKSTLANKIFKDSRITRAFVKRIWVKVPRSNEQREIYLSILTEMTKKASNEYASYSVQQLVNGIRTWMENAAKCLIILDDVWNTQLMNMMRCVAPKEGKGHRIIATTRQLDVAEHFNRLPHRLKFLSDKNSWKLLKRKVFQKKSCPVELKKTGRRIAGKCEGLPLAVVVIAGALTEQTPSHWEMVEDSVGERLKDSDNLEESCFEFVRESYDSLKYDQKACFLYCASFPRGFDIPTRKLFRLWIAEGLIHYSGELDFERKAMEYLNNLVNRNLVMVTEKKSNGQIKRSRLHDLLYEFCKQEANNNEDLFQEIRRADQYQVSDTARRLTVPPSTLQQFLTQVKSEELVRSFLCFDTRPIEMPPICMLKLYKAFPLLRVLDVQPVQFLFNKELYKLFHLRYIALSGKFDTLPESLDKLWNIQTIIIDKIPKEGTLRIKTNIWKMQELRHFHVNVPAILPSPDEGTKDNKCSLHTLSLITPGSCTKEILGRAPGVKKLGIRGDPSILLTNNKSEMSEISKALENFKLQNGHDKTNILRTSAVLFEFAQSLKKLTLSGTWLEWNYMAKLGQLQLLKVLKLKENAFTGEYWKTEINGFSCLLVLWIERTNLRKWEASPSCFPQLKHLTLKLCNELEEIPEDLAHVSNLQEINLEHVPITAVKSARRIKGNKQGCEIKLSVHPDDIDCDTAQ